MGLHDENAAVTQVHFLPHQVKSANVQLLQMLVQQLSFLLAVLQVELVTLLDDNSLHMWTLKGHKGVSELLEIGRFVLTGPPG